MRRHLTALLLLTALPLLGTFGCSSDGSGSSDPTEEQQGKPETDGKIVDGKADAWNYTNNPSRFGINFDYKYDDLKQYQTGRAEQIPWPSDYWATYEDSINVRYHGPDTLSPAEKYDKAFNNWTPNMDLTPVDLYSDCEDHQIKNVHKEYYDHLGPAASWQHRYKGNWRARNGKDDDNDEKIDECGGSDYDGIETWWGLCHAWTPASIIEPEPLHPVTINGVEFTVSDIKALLISQYDRTSSVMLGGRCNEKEIKRDEHGRIEQEECRDTNAGAFFVVMTNMLGRDKRAFVEDRTPGYQVWNQPVLGYQITTDEEMTEEQAMKELGHEGEKYTDVFDSPKAVAWRHIRMNVDYISESSSTTEGALTPHISSYTRTDRYNFIIELDKDGKVVGGEWIGQSMHPDFLWLPIRARGGNPNIDLAKVHEILEMARKTDTPDPTDDVKVTEFGGDVDVAIPDNDEGGVSTDIEVTDDMKIGSLKVKVTIDHTYVGDLKIVLARGDKEIVLRDRTGGGQDDLDETFDVSDFDGESIKGTWTLKVYDLANRDKGSIKQFKLLVSDKAGAPANTKTYTNDAGIDIPDDDDDGITSVIEVNDEGSIKALRVKVDITHTFVGDLVVELEHGGSKQTLTSREGGSADNLVKTFKVDSFAGAPVKGEWKLHVFDKAKRDIGKLNTWTLEADL